MKTILLALLGAVIAQQDDYASLDLLNPKKKRDLVHVHLQTSNLYGNSTDL